MEKKLLEAKQELETGEYLHPKTPEYVYQLQKHERYWQDVNAELSTLNAELNQKLEEQHEKDLHHSMNLQTEMEKRKSQASQVLSKIEENREIALKKHQDRMKEVVHMFVEKQIKAAENREEKEKLEMVEIKKQLKKRKERVERAAERKKEEEKKRLRDLREQKKKKMEREEHMEEIRQQNMEILHERMDAHREHMDQVKHNHHEVLEEFHAEADRTMMKLVQRAHQIEEKKQKEQEMVAERKRRLAELEKEKAKFKKVFEEFQGNDHAQKVALEKLKAQGIKSKELQRLIEDMEREEEEKKKRAEAKKKAQEEGDQ